MNQVLEDVVRACKPKSATISGVFRPRGGIGTTVEAHGRVRKFKTYGYNASTFMPNKTYPYAMLAVLTGLNILNYIDRSVLFAVQPLIKKEFQVSDAQIGALTTVFLLSYMVAAPLVGWLGDRYPRKYIVIFGIAIWSGFTFLSWLVKDYNQLLFRHTIVGIGEASYAAIAPTLIADSFPFAKRGRMLSIFYIGLPFGTAAGYLVGGYFSHLYGWRAPFMVAGAPGFLLAVLFWFLPEPVRGQSDEIEAADSRSGLRDLAQRRFCHRIARHGGLLICRRRHAGVDTNFSRACPPSQSGNCQRDFGGITLFNGFVATLLGGWIGDRLLKKYFGAYYTFPGIAMLIAVPSWWPLYVAGPMMFPGIFVAVFFILIGTGPTNAALVNSVSAGIRSTALAVNVFVIHLLGDAFSPTLMGKVSDKTGSLQTAFWTAFIAAALSGVILIYGARFAPRSNRRQSLFRATGHASAVLDFRMLVALGWAIPVMQHDLHRVANLTDPKWDPPGITPMPPLTIVVPARNEAAGLEPAIRSLLRLNYPDYQIIAINDRSTDQLANSWTRF